MGAFSSVWPQSEGAEGVIEPGEAVFTSSQAYAISSLSSGASSQSEISWISPKGNRVISLGSAQGQSAPAQLAWLGQRLYFAHFSSDAGHYIARLGQVTHIDSDPRVHWGPRIEQGRDTSLISDLAVNVAGPVLVWDEPVLGTARSQVKGYWAGKSASLKTSARGSYLLSEGNSDCDSPQLIAQAAGFYLSYLSYPRQNISAAGSSLVQEPLSLLKLRRLSKTGQPRGESLNINLQPLRILGFDMSFNTNKAQLIYWYYGGASNKLILASAEVGADGSIQRAQMQVEFPSAGSFALFDPGLTQEPLPTWILGPARNAGGFLAELNGSVIKPFESQSIFRGRFPLIRSSSELVLARPVGLGFELNLANCAVSADETNDISLKKSSQGASNSKN